MTLRILLAAFLLAASLAVSITDGLDMHLSTVSVRLVSSGKFLCQGELVNNSTVKLEPECAPFDWARFAKNPEQLLIWHREFDFNDASAGATNHSVASILLPEPDPMLTWKVRITLSKAIPFDMAEYEGDVDLDDIVVYIPEGPVPFLTVSVRLARDGTFLCTGQLISNVTVQLGPECNRFNHWARFAKRPKELLVRHEELDFHNTSQQAQEYKVRHVVLPVLTSEIRIKLLEAVPFEITIPSLTLKDYRDYLLFFLVPLGIFFLASTIYHYCFKDKVGRPKRGPKQQQLPV